MTGAFDRFSDYDFRHWVSVQAEAGAHESVDRLLALRGRDNRNSWFEAKETRSELSGYIADLDTAWSAANSSVAKRTRRLAALGLQLRYALISGAIRDLAANLKPEFLARCVQSGIWHADQAVAWATLSPDPQTSLQVVVEELRRDAGEGRERLGRLALSVGASIKDADNRVLAVANMAGDIPVYLLRQAFAVVAQEQNEGSRLGGLRSLITKLPDNLKLEALETARQFKQDGLRAEALALVAAHLPAPHRARAFEEFLEQTRIQLGSSDREIRVRELARLLSPDEFQRFGALLDSKHHRDAYEDFLVVRLGDLVDENPARACQQAKNLPSWKADGIYMRAAKIFATRSLHSEAWETAEKVANREWDQNPKTLAEILKTLPAAEWSRWTSIVAKMSDSPGFSSRLKVLTELGGWAPSKECLSSIIRLFCKNESEQLETRASAAAILSSEQREELLHRVLGDQPSFLRRSVVIHLLPFLSVEQVKTTLDTLARPDSLDDEPFSSLLVRLAELQHPGEAIHGIATLRQGLEFNRAKLASDLAPHLSREWLLRLRGAILPRGIAFLRARARCTLVPWLPAEKVETVVLEACSLEDHRDRIHLLSEVLHTFPVASLNRANQALLDSLERLLTSRLWFNKELPKDAFLALSQSLERRPSSEASRRAIGLATHKEFEPRDQLSFLMALVESGGSDDHVCNALSTAFGFATGNPDLFPIFAQGLSERHSPALSTLARDHQSDSQFILYLVAAGPFLTARAKETAYRRVAEMNEPRLKLYGLGVMLPELEVAERTAAITAELKKVSEWRSDSELFVQFMVLVTRTAPSVAHGYEKELTEAFLQLDDWSKISNAGSLVDALRRPAFLTPALAAANRLAPEEMPYAISALAPWLDESQFASSLKRLAAGKKMDENIWLPLLTRANELNRTALLLDCLDSIDNEFAHSRLLVELTPQLPLDALAWVGERLRALDSRGLQLRTTRALGALAVRAAELGDMTMTFEFLEWKGNNRDSKDRTLERVFEAAPRSCSSTLFPYAEKLLDFDQPVVLAKLVRKVSPKRRRAVLESIVNKFSFLRGSSGETRLRVVREIAAELVRLPRSQIISMWSRRLDSSSKEGREAVFVEVCAFAPILLHHFGRALAIRFEDAIRIGGTDHWP